MSGAKITITPELAIRVGALAEHYRDASVEIAYDDDRDERLWQVTFEFAGEHEIEEHRYIVDDESGIAMPDLGHGNTGRGRAPIDGAFVREQHVLPPSVIQRPSHLSDGTDRAVKPNC